MRECMRTMSYADSGLWRLFPLNNNPNSLPTLLAEMCPRSVVEGGADQTGGGAEGPPCIKIGYSSRLVPGAEKGLPAMY